MAFSGRSLLDCRRRIHGRSVSSSGLALVDERGLEDARQAVLENADGLLCADAKLYRPAGLS